jgi:hypothetical protein
MPGRLQWPAQRNHNFQNQNFWNRQFGEEFLLHPGAA